MRRLAVLAPLAILAAGLLAWRRRRARATVGAPLAAAPHGAALVPADPGLPAAAPALPAAAPAPATAAAPLRFASVPWDLVAAPGDRGELTIRCAVGADMALDRVDAQETPTQVFVTALARRRTDVVSGDGADAPPDREATVALSGPLGGRELVHAPVDVEAPGGGGREPRGGSGQPGGSDEPTGGAPGGSGEPSSSGEPGGPSLYP